MNDEGRAGAPTLPGLADRTPPRVGFRAVLEARSDLHSIHFLKGVVPGSGATPSSGGGDGLEHPADESGGADRDRERIAAVLEAARRLPAGLKLALEVHCTTLLKDQELAQWLEAEASKRGIVPSRLIAEIVELPDSAVDAKLDRALRGLRDLGLKIALGKVKLGSAVFQQVRRHHPEYLVLGSGFSENCHGSYFRRAALASVAQLARDCGCRVVARGARNGADLAAVTASGIDLIEDHDWLDPETAGFA